MKPVLRDGDFFDRMGKDLTGDGAKRIGHIAPAPPLEHVGIVVPEGQGHGQPELTFLGPNLLESVGAVQEEIGGDQNVSVILESDVAPDRVMKIGSRTPGQGAGNKNEKKNENGSVAHGNTFLKH